MYKTQLENSPNDLEEEEAYGQIPQEERDNLETIDLGNKIEKLIEINLNNTINFIFKNKK